MTKARKVALWEIIEALSAIRHIEADVRALDPSIEQFSVVLTFERAQCPEDWIAGQPKPSWLIEQILEELHAWQHQQAMENRWVSKEEQMGSSIDTLILHYAVEMKKASAVSPQNMLTRMRARVFADTVLRLKELKDRREAGGVYSQTESSREKARKTWAEEEYEASKREQEQHQQYQRQHYEYQPYRPEAGNKEYSANEELHKVYEDQFKRWYEEGMFRHGDPFGKPPPKPAASQPWWCNVLGVPVKASKIDVQKAYRKLAAKHHPDKHVDPYMKTLAEQKMADINRARDEALGGL